MYVEKQLGISTSETQEYNSPGVTFLSGDNFQVDVYYAQKNVFYTCALKNTPDGNWQLISLKAK